MLNNMSDDDAQFDREEHQDAHKSNIQSFLTQRLTEEIKETGERELCKSIIEVSPSLYLEETHTTN